MSRTGPTTKVMVFSVLYHFELRLNSQHGLRSHHEDELRDLWQLKSTYLFSFHLAFYKGGGLYSPSRFSWC